MNTVNNLVLTKEELAELTGKQKYSAQAKVLRTLGFHFKLRKTDGFPLLDRNHYLQEMGVGGNTQPDSGAEIKLNLDKL